MAVEKFEPDTLPSTSLHLTVYNDDGEIIPAWWLEIEADDNYDLAEIVALLDCLPSISEQLQKLLEFLS